MRAGIYRAHPSCLPEGRSGACPLPQLGLSHLPTHNQAKPAPAVEAALTQRVSGPAVGSLSRLRSQGTGGHHVRLVGGSNETLSVTRCVDARSA